MTRKRKKAPRFERAGASKYYGSLDDERGRVRIYVRLIHRDNSQVVKGNVSRTITLKDVTVTEVADAIERTLIQK